MRDSTPRGTRLARPGPLGEGALALVGLGCRRASGTSRARPPRRRPGRSRRRAPVVGARSCRGCDHGRREALRLVGRRGHHLHQRVEHDRVDELELGLLHVGDVLGVPPTRGRECRSAKRYRPRPRIHSIGRPAPEPDIEGEVAERVRGEEPLETRARSPHDLLVGDDAPATGRRSVPGSAPRIAYICRDTSSRRCRSPSPSCRAGRAPGPRRARPWRAESSCSRARRSASSVSRWAYGVTAPSSSRAPTR